MFASARRFTMLFFGLGMSAVLLLQARAADDEKENFQTARARRTSQNNLKQIGLAMHNYHDANGCFPPATVYSKDGKPLYSWRVLLLPYLEQDALYRQFKLDEPWDSDHNKKLLAIMPKIYAPTIGKTKEPNCTYYQVFVGKGAAFENGKKVRLQDIGDGTSNTILAVEAGDAVPWAKPADLECNPDKPLPKLGGLFKGPFNVLFADGSVHVVKRDFDEKIMRAAITRNGAEVVDLGELSPKRK